MLLRRPRLPRARPHQCAPRAPRSRSRSPTRAQGAERRAARTRWARLSTPASPRATLSPKSPLPTRIVAARARTPPRGIAIAGTGVAAVVIVATIAAARGRRRTSSALRRRILHRSIPRVRIRRRRSLCSMRRFSRKRSRRRMWWCHGIGGCRLSTPNPTCAPPTLSNKTVTAGFCTVFLGVRAGSPTRTRGASRICGVGVSRRIGGSLASSRLALALSALALLSFVISSSRPSVSLGVLFLARSPASASTAISIQRVGGVRDVV
ncbi:hypothetical protein DFH06DRAFT_261371 [Mycena polygramma]|nr:hypothetical protein DFH06DRAFT_261371 [Mycena polygramma]